MYPSVNGLVAEPVNIALSWYIDVRFGDLRQDVITAHNLGYTFQCVLPTFWYVLLLFYAHQMLMHLLFLSLSSTPIFLVISLSRFYHSIFYIPLLFILSLI